VQLRRTRCAYVPQNPAASLNPNLRIRVAARHALASCGTLTRGDFAGRLSAVASDVGLPANADFWERYPGELSGGQQQRVVLALALLRRASYVVFDEPTTGLDVVVQQRVLRTIREIIAAKEMTGVFISHDLAVIRAVGDDVVIMYSGEVVETGPVADVIARPKHPYTRGLIAAVVSADAAKPISGIRGMALPPTVGASGCRFEPRCEFVQRQCKLEHPVLRPVQDRGSVRCVVSLAGAVLGTDERRGNARLGEGATPAVDEVALEVTSLFVILQARLIVRDVSLCVARGQTLAVVGESGAGKTTLSRCLAGLIAGEAKVARLFGKALALDGSMRSRPIEQKRQLQYIFQDPYAALNPRVRICRTLARPLERLAGVKGREEMDGRLRRLLNDVALDQSVLAKLPAQLSGGERQRVCIARALAADPSLLICDEPTSSLDVSVQASILRLLLRLKEERHLTLVIITHDLGIVRLMADQVLVMRDGAMVDYGSVDEVFSRRDGYSAELREAVLSLGG